MTDLHVITTMGTGLKESVQASAAGSALASWRSAVSKPSVHQP